MPALCLWKSVWGTKARLQELQATQCQPPPGSVPHALSGNVFTVGEVPGDSCLCVPAHVNFTPVCQSFREIFSCITWLREAACSCLVGIVRVASAPDLLCMTAKSLTFNFCCSCFLPTVLIVVCKSTQNTSSLLTPHLQPRVIFAGICGDEDC